MRSIILLLIIWATSLNGTYSEMSHQDIFSKQDLECMTANVFYEARGEPLLGKKAVAQVTLNRLAKKEWGKSVCEVVYKKKQFSWTAKGHRAAPPGPPRLDSALVALEALATRRYSPHDPTGGATWFHSAQMRKPPWTRKLYVSARIGGHVFYTQGPKTMA